LTGGLGRPGVVVTPVIVVVSPAPLPCEVSTPSGTIDTGFAVSTKTGAGLLIGEMTTPGPTVMILFVPSRSCLMLRFL